MEKESSLQSINTELKGFKENEITQEESWTNSLFEFDKKNFEIQIKDNLWKIEARPKFAHFFLGILIVQNIFVFGLVLTAFWFNTLKDLSLILGVLVAATLTETYLVIRIVIKWVFQDIKYTLQGRSVSKK